MNSTGTPGGSEIPAGWYDDPSGNGLRWWDGEQWTEHVHSAEATATAATVVGTAGTREGAPPRDLVKLRERIRARGVKSVGVVLGAIVLVIVVVALLLSGSSDDSGAGFEPGLGVPGASGNPTPGGRSGRAARQAAKARRQLHRSLKGGNGGAKAARRALRAERKALDKAGAGDPQAQIEAAQKAAKEALESSE